MCLPAGYGRTVLQTSRTGQRFRVTSVTRRHFPPPLGGRAGGGLSGDALALDGAIENVYS
jgi:hypothetical protein